MCGSGQFVLSPAWGLLPLLVIVALYMWRRDRRNPRTWIGLAALAYLGLLLSLTFLPLPLPPYELFPGCPFVFTQPFGTISGALRSGLRSSEMEYLIGNVVAFMPVGVLLPLLRPTLARPWLAVIGAGFGLSLAIESGQLLASLAIGFAYRQADVDDVIANTFGALAGYALFVAIRGIGRALASRARLE